MELTTTKTRRVTYMGIPCETYEILTGGPLSLRIAVRTFTQTSTTLAKVIKGDGRTDNFQIFVPATEVTPAELDLMREQLAAGRWS